jgi:hypothetical protein
MASKPDDDLLFALRRFIKAIDPEQNEPGTLGHNELAAGKEVLSAIDRIVDARVQAALKNALPKSVPAIMADHRQRTPR